MKRLSLPLVALLAGMTGAMASSSAHPGALYLETSSGTVVARGRGTDDDKRALRDRVRQGEQGTYIDDILAERDSSLARWHDRPNDPVTVWIQPNASIKNWNPEFIFRVRDAFQAWDAVDLPLHFRFVSDSSAAEVRVTWIDHFDEPISGRTRWVRDDNWWIVSGSIVLAVHHQKGETLDPDAMRAMALHEVGHLIGLDHTTDPDAIMSPRVRVRALQPEDRATIKLLYSIPSPGSMR